MVEEKKQEEVSRNITFYKKSSKNLITQFLDYLKKVIQTSFSLIKKGVNRDLAKDFYILLLILFGLCTVKKIYNYKFLRNINFYIILIGMKLYFTYVLYMIFHKYKNDEEGVIEEGIKSFRFVLFVIGGLMFGEAISKEKLIIWNYVYFLIMVVLYTSLLGLKIELEEENKEKDRELEKQNSDIKLYPTRKNQAEMLEKYLTESDNLHSFILIDGEWGIGKTTFVKAGLKYVQEKNRKDLQEVKNKLEKESNENNTQLISELNKEKEKLERKVRIDYEKRIININAMLFSIKKEMIKVVFDELESYLEENKICVNGFREVSEYLESIMSEAKGVFGFLKNKKGGYEEKKTIIKKKLGLLNKENQPILVVDNIERIEDKKHIIEILGFLHEVEEIEYIQVIVLADKNKLEDEKYKLDKNYFQKFFLKNIKLEIVGISEIIEEIEKIDKDNIEELGKEIESFYLQRLSKFNGRIEELEKIIKSPKGDKDELEIELIRKEYNIEKNRFINYVMNPRTVEKIYRKTQEKEKELEGLFNEKIAKATYISIIIFNEMFKWKEIDISDFDRIFSNDVRGVNDDRIYVNCEGIDLFLYDLFSYYEKKYKKSEIRAISTVNFPLLDIIKAKSEVEELKISKIYIMQKNIEIYASTILDYSDSKLKEYFQKMKEKILFDFSLFSSDLNIDYNYFVKLDRNDWLEGNSSIIHEFTKKNELRLIFQEDEANFKINRLEKAILEESTFAFYKIYGIKRQSNSSINRFWELEKIIFDLGIGVIQEKGNEDIIQENARLICEDIEARIEKNETNDDLFLANEYLKYFLVIYKHYYSINYLGETKEEVHINKNFDELKKIRNQIEEKEKIRKEKKENREFRKIEELEKEMEELEKEIACLIKEEIYKREFNNIKFKETMQDIINIDKITPLLYNYRIGGKGIKEIYFQYVKEKKIEGNKDFENALNRIKYKHVIN